MIGIRHKLPSITPLFVAHAALLIVLFAFAHFTAYWLRFDGQLGDKELASFWPLLFWVVAIKVVVFGCSGVGQKWTKYVTFHDFVALLQAASLSSVIIALFDYIIVPESNVPRSVFMLDWAVTIVLVGGLQSVGRILAERELPSFMTIGRTPVLIIGTNATGELLLRAIRRDATLAYRVVGFIGETAKNALSSIEGVPILGTLEQTGELAKRMNVREVLITAGELPGKQVRQLIDDARQHNVAVKVLPSLTQLLRGQVDLRPRTVAIEDLLQRDPVKLDTRELHRWIDDRVLLVTGSAGSIGSEICRQLLRFSPKKLLLVDRSESGQFFLERELRRLRPDANIEVCMADINDGMRMNAIFNQQRPEIVFHAAAYKHVPLMEDNAGEAIKNIPHSTRIVADLAHRFGAKSFVQISTDKAVNPTNVMGACKRVAELYVQALAGHSKCQFITVRFGNVLDSAGSVVPIFREQIAAGGPVTVTHPEMRRYFMTIPEASQLVIQAGAMGKGGEIFVLDMGEPAKIVDLASDMIRLSGLQLGQDIEIEFVGIRPGEKLFEELHVEGEMHLPTSHSKIFVTQSTAKKLDDIKADLDCLMNVTHCPNDEIRDELRKIVPHFSPRSAGDSTSSDRKAA